MAESIDPRSTTCDDQPITLVDVVTHHSCHIDPSGLRYICENFSDCHASVYIYSPYSQILHYWIVWFVQIAWPAKRRRLRHNVNYVKTTTTYVTMTRTELISAPASWTQSVFQRFFFISLRNFNQLDATSKVMYRHEIICTGNKAYLINNYLFRDNAVAASLWKIRE